MYIIKKFIAVRSCVDDGSMHAFDLFVQSIVAKRFFGVMGSYSRKSSIGQFGANHCYSESQFVHELKTLTQGAIIRIKGDKVKEKKKVFIPPQ